MPNQYYAIPGASKQIEKAYRLHSNTLQGSVQSLLKLLMNKEIMAGVMVKFNLDTAKMPLGRVSRKQIVEGMFILIEIERKIFNKESHESLVEASGDC